MQIVRLVGGLLTLLLSVPVVAQSAKETPRPDGGRPEIGRYCKVYRAGEGLKALLLRIGPDSKNESLVALDGFDHPWDGKIFKASVTKADERQEFMIQNNSRPFVVLVFRERYGQPTLFVPKYGTEETERLLVYSEDLSAGCKPDSLLSQYLQQPSGKK